MIEFCSCLLCFDVSALSSF